jgi:Ca-activated chloride channel homolog
MDALDHYAAALAIQDDKGVRENRDELLRRIKVVEQQQQQTQQQQKKDQNQKEQKGEQQEQQDGEGQPQDGNPKQEEKGDKPDSKGKQGKEDKPQDGKQAEGEQGKEEKGGETPEGKIEAAEAGDKPGDKKAKEMVMAEEVRDDKTGFSKNEARALLRTYNEVVQDALKKAQERLRAREPGRDW